MSFMLVTFRIEALHPPKWWDKTIAHWNSLPDEVAAITLEAFTDTAHALTKTLGHSTQYTHFDYFPISTPSLAYCITISLLAHNLFTLNTTFHHTYNNISLKERACPYDLEEKEILSNTCPA